MDGQLVHYWLLTGSEGVGAALGAEPVLTGGWGAAGGGRRF